MEDWWPFGAVVLLENRTVSTPSDVLSPSLFQTEGATTAQVNLRTRAHQTIPPSAQHRKHSRRDETQRGVVPRIAWHTRHQRLRRGEGCLLCSYPMPPKVTPWCRPQLLSACLWPCLLCRGKNGHFFFKQRNAIHWFHWHTKHSF